MGHLRAATNKLAIPLHGQAGLNSSVTVGLLTATPACRHGIPTHLGVKPDRQRAAALERFVKGWPVPGLVSRWCRSAHACQLPRWIHEMNPLRIYATELRAITDFAADRAGVLWSVCTIVLPVNWVWCVQVKRIWLARTTKALLASPSPPNSYHQKCFTHL